MYPEEDECAWAPFLRGSARAESREEEPDVEAAEEWLQRMSDRYPDAPVYVARHLVTGDPLHWPEEERILEGSSIDVHRSPVNTKGSRMHFEDGDVVVHLDATMNINELAQPVCDGDNDGHELSCPRNLSP